MTQEDQRVSYSEALSRLEQLSHLVTVIDAKWLKEQYQKPVEKYALLTGWLSSSEACWDSNLMRCSSALNAAVGNLSSELPQHHWNSIRRKLRRQSVRADSKGILAEISLAVFLANHKLPFEMNKNLSATSSKDVDFSVVTAFDMAVHIEVQWLSPPGHEMYLAQASATYQVSYPLNFAGLGRRAIDKVYSKTPKLTAEVITLVALNCTDVPWVGRKTNTIPDATEKAYGTTPLKELDDKESTVRRLVDGVIWFETEFENRLMPIERGFILNPHSPFREEDSLKQWINLWTTK